MIVKDPALDVPAPTGPMRTYVFPMQGMEIEPLQRTLR